MSHRPTHPPTHPSTTPLAAVQGALALDLGLHPAPAGRPDLRLVEPPNRGPAGEVNIWAGRFAQAVVEVLGGDRPVSQLLRWTSARVYADLDRRVKILGRTTGVEQRARTIRPQVRSVHVYQPDAASAEVSVHVRHGHRSRAIAARLELRRDRWQCTVLLLG